MSRCVLQYTVTVDQSWLSVTPSSGLLNEGESIDLLVTYDTDQLAVGRHTANITITDANASNSPVVVPVTLDVTSVPATPQDQNSRSRRHKYVRKYPQPINPSSR